MESVKFLPDIDDYLDQTENSQSVKTDGLEELIYRVRGGTGLDLFTSEQIVRLLFQEIRNQLLRGKTVYLSGYGTFSVRDKNRKIRSPKFKLNVSLKRRLNEQLKKRKC